MPDISDSTGRVLGDGRCPVCGGAVKVKVNKKNHLYTHCEIPAEGGCASQVQSRSDVGDKRLARYITKWDRPEERTAYLGDNAPAPKRPTPPRSPSVTKPAPAPAPVAAESSGKMPWQRW